MQTRRTFATAMLGLMAAPLIVRASSIMPVSFDGVGFPEGKLIPPPRLIAARFDDLGVNPVYEIGQNGRVVGERRVADTWDTWQGEVLDLRGTLAEPRLKA